MPLLGFRICKDNKYRFLNSINSYERTSKLDGVTTSFILLISQFVIDGFLNGALM